MVEMELCWSCGEGRVIVDPASRSHVCESCGLEHGFDNFQTQTFGADGRPEGTLMQSVGEFGYRERKIYYAKAPHLRHHRPSPPLRPPHRRFRRHRQRVRRWRLVPSTHRRLMIRFMKMKSESKPTSEVTEAFRLIELFLLHGVNEDEIEQGHYRRLLDYHIFNGI